MSNHFLPIVEKPPFRTSAKVGGKASIKTCISGGHCPIFHVDPDWTIIGFRHDEKTSRQELIVLQKGNKTINMDSRDVYLY